MKPRCLFCGRTVPPGRATCRACRFTGPDRPATASTKAGKPVTVKRRKEQEEDRS